MWVTLKKERTTNSIFRGKNKGFVGSYWVMKAILIKSALFLITSRDNLITSRDISITSRDNLISLEDN